MRRALLSSSLIFAAFLISAVAPVHAHQAGVAGTWKLNKAQNNNPNGLPPGQNAPAKPQNAGGEKDMTDGMTRPGAASGA